MEVLNFIKSIPFVLKAKESAMESDELQNAFDRELQNLTTVYARNKNRFYPVKRMKTPFYMWRKKQHVLDILNIMNLSHKENNLSTPQKEELAKLSARVDRKSYSDIPMTSTRAKTTNWTA